MVFDPTFHDLEHRSAQESAGLDLDSETDVAEGIDDLDGAAEGEAASAIESGAVTGDDLPPLGE